jgi:eukaryotic-like serine/threonine-protein kinase
MTQVELSLEPGSILAGKYRIERVLGQGGMGIVAAAWHVQLEQRVALKLMLPHAMLNGEAVGRFLREARAAARISSEHVARVFDVGALETGEPYIAMEYLEGLDLAQLLAERGRVSVEEAIDYVLQACEALAEAHAAGIVHRDLKPGNLFLMRRVDGRRFVKVLDFGISKVSGGSGHESAPATRTSALMGSPLYMSPEQMGSSKNVDARSDVWALGVVLYEMVSGTPPFNGETLPQVCARVMSEPPPPLAAAAPGLPPVLYEVVHRCLEKDPARRYPSVAELGHALEPLASPNARQSIERISHILGVTRSVSQTGTAGAPALATGASITGAPAASVPPQGTHAAWGETNPSPAARRRAAPWIAAAVLAVAGAAGLLALRPWARADRGEEPAASATRPAVDRERTPAVPSLAPQAAVAAAPAIPSAASEGEPVPTPSALPPTPSVTRPVAGRAAKPAVKPPAAAKPATPAAVAAPPAGPASPQSPAPTSTRSRL